MATGMCKTWREKLSVLLVIGCLIANYSFKGIKFNHTGKEKCKEKTTGHDDCKRFRRISRCTALAWNGPKCSTRDKWQEKPIHEDTNLLRQEQKEHKYFPDNKK